MPQHSYEIAATSVQYAVFDNLLLVFNDAGAVYVLDVDAAASTAVSGPQPFRMAQAGVTFMLLIAPDFSRPLRMPSVLTVITKRPQPCLSFTGGLSGVSGV